MRVCHLHHVTATYHVHQRPHPGISQQHQCQIQGSLALAIAIGRRMGRQSVESVRPGRSLAQQDCSLTQRAPSWISSSPCTDWALIAVRKRNTRASP